MPTPLIAASQVESPWPGPYSRVADDDLTRQGARVMAREAMERGEGGVRSGSGKGTTKSYIQLQDEAMRRARATVGLVSGGWEVWQYHMAMLGKRAGATPTDAPKYRVPKAPLPFSGAYYATTMPPAKSLKN